MWIYYGCYRYCKYTTDATDIVNFMLINSTTRWNFWIKQLTETDTEEIGNFTGPIK